MTAPITSGQDANPLASSWIVREYRTIRLTLLALFCFLVMNSALSLAELPAPLEASQPLRMLMLSGGMFTSTASDLWMRRSTVVRWMLSVVSLALIIGSLFVEQ